MTFSAIVSAAQVFGAAAILLFGPFVVVYLRDLRTDVRDLRDNHILHIWQELATLKERISAHTEAGIQNGNVRPAARRRR